MSKRVEEALKKHKEGYNCAQCVACSFLDKIGIEEDLAFRMTEGFGAGLGGMKGTCGALTGAGAVFGLVNSTGTQGPGSKGSTYQMSKELMRRFEEKNGSTVCCELKGIRTKQILRSCDGCIQDAVEIAEDILEGNE